MNFMDYCFFTILLLSGFAGAYQGLERSVIGLVGAIFTFVVSIIYYPRIAMMLKEYTPIYDSLKESTISSFNGQAFAPGIDKLAQLNDNIVGSLVGKISAPPAIKRFLIDKVSIDVANIGTAQVIEILATKSVDIFINIMGFILIFAVLQGLFILLQNSLGTIFTMPILNEVNIIGGFGFGIVQGIITIFVICAGWSMLSGTPMYREVFVDLEASKYAKMFYDNNLVLDILIKFLK